MRKAIFLDRDGVINKKPPPHDYVKKWEEFKFISGMGKLIKKANKKGYLVIIVTNQRGIGRGLMTKADLKKIHRRMCGELKRKGARIDAIYYCPHNIKDNCDCRKPKAGLFLRAAKDWNVSLEKSIAIGDSKDDVCAAAAAGCGVIIKVNFEKEKDFYFSLIERLID